VNVTPSEPEVKDLLNAQTARLEWQELMPHFARGMVVCVQPGQDLVAVAAHLVRDDSELVDRLIADGLLYRATDHDARRWNEAATRFWAVVVAPWVVVQESTTSPTA
jgi:hypothetical protein